MEKGKIFLGFPCIGKSKLCEYTTSFIDLNISDFVDCKKDTENTAWVKVYVNVAIRMVNSGHNVFLTTHPLVRQEVYNRAKEGAIDEFIILLPNPCSRLAFINRAKTRCETDIDDLAKHQISFENISNNFCSEIKDIIDECSNIESDDYKGIHHDIYFINDIEKDLYDVLKFYKLI